MTARPIQSPVAFAFPASQPRHYAPLWERLHSYSPSHQDPLVCITPKQRGYTSWREWGRYQQLLKIKQHAGCWYSPDHHQPVRLLMILGRLSFVCLFFMLSWSLMCWFGRDDCEQLMDIAVPSSMEGSGGQTGMAGLGHGETLDMHNYYTGCAAPGVVGGGGTFGEMEIVVEDQLCFGVGECLAPEIHLQQLEMDRLIATHVVISFPLSIFSFVIMFCFLFYRSMR